jgi:hypothetical protein
MVAMVSQPIIDARQAGSPSSGHARRASLQGSLLNNYSANLLILMGNVSIRCVVIPPTATSTSQVRTMSIVSKITMTAVAALTIAGTSVIATSSADAQGFRGHRGGHHYYGGHHRGWGGGRGFGIGAGIATGLALGGLGYYGYNNYYGGCYVQRRLVIDQWGRQFVRPVRVCS